MVGKRAKILILFLILLTLTISPAPVGAQSEWVGVRIPAQELPTTRQISDIVMMTIDYSSFHWGVISRANLAHLDSAGVNYLGYENPYHLTLGGQSFDPLVSTPVYELSWGQKAVSAGPDLHLVQFYGPTKTEWLTSLVSVDLEVVQYIHPFTYVVWGTPETLGNLKEETFVRWTGVYLPAYAVQPQNRQLAHETHLVRMMIYPQADLERTTQAIETLGGELLGVAKNVDPSFDLATFNLPGDRLLAAASLPGVYTIQPLPTDGGNRGEMSNQVVAGNLDTNNRAFPGYLAWLSSIGLSGTGVVIANVDDGVDQNHPDLINRMLPCTGSTCAGVIAKGHGTHTAGIIAGDGSSLVADSFGFLRGLGMAPGANLVAQVYTLASTDPDQMLTLMTQSHRNNAVISGNSWGPSSTPRGYDLDTRLVDIGVRDADPHQPGNQPLTYILSIMNGFGKKSTQGTPDEAKNILVVGSTYLQDTTGIQHLNINDLSVNTAHGPALDGRHIPHLVAPGYCVDSTNFPGSGHSLRCGTSMASPHVTGAVALFYEHYRTQYGVDPSPALVKAAFLPVAHSLAGNRDADGNNLGHPFDSKQGWGRLNANAVLQPEMEVLYFDQDFLFDETGQTWSVDLSSSEPIQELRAMLVWTDAPGHGKGGDTPAWVNDLDLSISIAGQTYYGNNFGGDEYSIPGGTPDRMNNTEGIFLRALPAGEYTFTVTAANISGDGVPNIGGETDQDFALVIYYSQGPVIEPPTPTLTATEIPSPTPTDTPTPTPTETAQKKYQYIFPLFYKSVGIYQSE